MNHAHDHVGKRKPFTRQGGKNERRIRQGRGRIQGLYSPDADGYKFKSLLSSVVFTKELKKMTVLREHAWSWTNDRDVV